MNTQRKLSVTSRELETVFVGIPTQDGAGVKMTRIIGTQQLNMLDPFLLLDAFESDQPSDYIGGFPSHPHRGFETVTYMLAGRMRHKDNVGNEGVIEPHGVQWMTAGKGIVHSEMPEQEQGLLKGFQLWVNLPQSDKMVAPNYQEFPASEIAEEHHENGMHIRVIAGITDRGTVGPVSKDTIAPTYMDVSLPSDAVFNQHINPSDNTFVYVIEGQLQIGEQQESLKAKHLGILTKGDDIIITAAENARFLLVSGQPLNESVARGGPFVMNSKQEVLQAFDDYKHNRF